jgi:hypothetical protein
MGFRTVLKNDLRDCRRETAFSPGLKRQRVFCVGTKPSRAVRGRLLAGTLRRQRWLAFLANWAASVP